MVSLGAKSLLLGTGAVAALALSSYVKSGNFDSFADDVKEAASWVRNTVASTVPTNLSSIYSGPMGALRDYTGRSWQSISKLDDTRTVVDGCVADSILPAQTYEAVQTAPMTDTFGGAASATWKDSTLCSPFESVPTVKSDM
jgi:hypothetical protein